MVRWCCVCMCVHMCTYVYVSVNELHMHNDLVEDKVLWQNDEQKW